MGEKGEKRIVAKFGTNLLTAGTERLDLEVMATLVGQVARLHQLGLEVIIVSSGAIAAGRQKLGLSSERRDIPSRQVMAAVGQSALMHSYEQLFGWHGITVAQTLLTKGDLSDRLGYLNARNTLLALLELGVVPIVNENDAVAVDEIEGVAFGDNDNLSGMVANLVDADLLVLLGDVAGLYTTDPLKDKSARLIPRVDRIDAGIERLAGGTRGRGHGGMATKVQAAKLATASGAAVVIADGREHDIILRLVGGESIGTLFPAATSKMESRKRFLLAGLATRGRLVVDDGAVVALKEQNRSLLPAGIRAVAGDFQRGDVVDIVSERGRGGGESEKGEKIACGISNYSSWELALIKGARSDRIEALLGYGYGDEVVHRNNLVVL
ncbi:MAG: glutamate 5-kinase [Dehalococcoidia bacterium]|nr:glutamate 5-kinase [Dehalococcoidia bacterium]